VKGKNLIWLLVAGILSGLLVTAVKHYGNDTKKIPQEGYRVYLEGRSIGLIKSKDELNEYINVQQEKLKEKYHVDTIYIPNNIDIVKEITYEDNFDNISNIYNTINTISPFTIKGYQVTIDRSNSTQYQNDENEEDTKQKIIKINVIDKDVFNKAIEEVVLSFVDQEEYESFKEKTKTDLEGSTGELIENIYIEDNITIKETNIPVNEVIYMDSEELTKYLIFGNNSSDKKYVVGKTDDIEKIAERNKMSVNELVIANKDLTSSNSLIFIGQELSIGVVDPLVTTIVEKHIVEDRVVKYKTIYQYDNHMYQGQQKTKQEGSNGKTRVTQKVKMMNGEIINAYIVSSEELKPVVNRIVVKGGKQIARGDGEWSWPTNFPYSISSPYGYRWGKLHTGVDIYVGGRGSPIYSARAGTVTAITSNGSSGFYVTIKHDNGYYTRYCHMQNTSGGDSLKGTHSATKYITVGQRVSAHQVIGEVGSSGHSTGAHCHFEIWNGPPFQAQSFNPMLFY
jgi:murein DD-endopeptidase MepM/ murein hydrolase activator NlpD